MPLNTLKCNLLTPLGLKGLNLWHVLQPVEFKRLIVVLFHLKVTVKSYNWFLCVAVRLCMHNFVIVYLTNVVIMHV